jgi:hypothetical protein
MRRGLEVMTAGTDVLGVDAPAVLVDVDASRSAPGELVSALLDTFGLDASEERVAEIAEAVGRPGYRRLP